MFFSFKSSSKPSSDSLNDDLIQFSETQGTEHDYDFDDDDDTLSLCDLPIYSSSSSSNGSCSMNRTEYQEEANSVFEFVSYSGDGEFNSRSDDDHGAIIFCGKLITCKSKVNRDHTSKPQSPRHGGVSDGGMKNSRNLRALFSWRRLKIGSFRKPASKNKPSPSSHGDSSQSFPSHSRSSLKSECQMEKMSSAKKVSTLLTSPAKSRWYLFMFGQTRFPQAMTMDLSDLKSRQRRLCSPSSSIKESALTVTKTNANDVVRAVGCVSLV